MGWETTAKLVDDDIVITTTWSNPEYPPSVETLPAYGALHTVEIMKRRNESGGYHFFEPDSMRFFRSRIAPGVMHGRVFITSEQFDSQSPRLYTVRAMRDNGSTVELCNFQAFSSLNRARTYVRNLYKEGSK